MNEFVLRGGLVVSVDGANVADVHIADGRIVALGDDVDAGDAQVLDCSGCWVGPGLVDIHTHLREPGEEWKEDIDTGSQAAASGGYTAVVAMPNTDPPTDAGHLARYIVDRGRAVGLVDVRAAGTVTAGRAGQKLAHLDELWDAGVRVFTDDGDVVADSGVLRRAMDYIQPRGGIIAQHAVDAGLALGGHVHEGAVASRLGIGAIPPEAETTVVRRDLELVRLTGCRYHVQHVSAAATVDLLAAAKAEGLPVTAEVTPHHLAFTDADVMSTDPAFKMMPPLRSSQDRAALIDGLRNGVIDCVATDHAPHADYEKDVPFEQAPFGVIGLEWAATVVNTAAGLDAVAFFDRMATRPAKIAGIGDHGRRLEPGVEANLMVFDPDSVAIATSGLSRSENAPYLGREYRGTVRHTFLRGATTHSSIATAAAAA